MPLAILDLSGNNLNSSINSFLFNFRRTLNEINLSDNNLQGPIPDGFGSMIAIKHLDLSENKLEGGIPESLGNCSTLISLQLSGNRLTGQLIELVRNLSWTNQSLLEYLILDGNQLDGSLPNAISKFSFLKELKLSFNKLSGSIPNVYGKLPNLAVLDLTGNQIEGSIPDFTLSSSIREISLSGNRLTGIVTESIGSLSNLEKLYLGSNDLGGEISEAHFTNLSRLQVLDLSFNSRLAMKFHSSNWTPPFQLNVIKLANCFLGPYFPNLLRNQENVSVLDVSVAGISGSIPKWFWHQFSGLRLMNLSHNHINGVLPDLSIQVAGLFLLDLSYNKFQGPVPHFPTKVTIGDLSHNMLSGPISFLCDDSFPNLGYLDLSDNMLSGVLPDCLDKSMIIYLNLANNNFSGKIPNSIGSLDMIKTLQLRNNSFTELPQSFRNCINLDFLDLGQNKFFGNIPAWLGESLSALVVLSLRGNRFNGSIPSNLCKLSNIRIIDFSENELVGAIPNCINNLTAMTREGSPTRAITHWYWYNFVDAQVQTNISYKSEAFLIWKGRQSKYKETLRLVKSIDLSSNKLTGEIPMEITSLIGLIGLNLSRNNFTGVINPRIGELRVLNFLDLSRNQLSGEIPTNLSQLSHLGVLDLSYNNLSGKIPMSTQLQTFNASTYEGNFLLCGSPLTKVCWGEESSRGRNFSDSKGDGRQKDIFDSLGFYVSIYLGIFFGFWGVFAILLLQRSWRYALFQMSDNLANRLYASTLVTMAKLRKWPGN
ncbi:hypothetical protein ACH5RR_007056 [Cinchona calisaya]|uniref:Uncharacterized protein n=1 Tax=Cinchona calisaya TaxID=153742 RepID=A0ABD3AQR5_9GENT